ncbi:MAG: hypothetical protein M3Q12_04970 [Pseudomonadota bacterium]|uniref:hypothetical protein n=1 Tax=Polaromonas sp. TaxID=1869339 RepID=UPI0017E35011|nr:hypothetical protein [Polaromonas sp.]MBA3595755.1 hypothetical protein [Polaromonas sp.]MDQ3271508.1 hypothetical protein [Pseudomonadota bacterium]
MKSKLLTTSLLASALFAGLGMAPAIAQNTSTPQVDRAQQAISARIQQGLNSGHITPSEAQALYARDRDIAAKEAFFKSNGQATPQERQQLRADLSALSADVERMMANNVHNAPRTVGTPGIDKQEYRISQRIDEGVRDGRISQREARRLHTRERALAQREASFKSDGVVTQQERRQLRNDLKALRDQVERAIRNDGRGRDRN